MRVVVQREKRDMTVSLRLMVPLRSMRSEIDAATAVMLERLLFCGATSNLDREESHGLLAALSGQGESRTTPGYSTIFLRVPSPFFPRALDLLASWVSNPVFNDEDIFNARERLANEAGRFSSMPLVTAVRALSGWWTGSIGGSQTFEPLGVGSYIPFLRASAIERVSQTNLRRMHSQIWVPSNMVLLVQGDIDIASCIDGVSSVFTADGGSPSGAISTDAGIDRAFQKMASVSGVGSPLKVSFSGGDRLLAIWPTVSFSDPRAPVLDIIAEMMCGNEKSLLGGILSGTGGPATEVRAVSHTPLGRRGIFAIEITPSSGKPEAICQPLMDCMAAVSRLDLSEKIGLTRKILMSRYSELFLGDSAGRMEMMGLEIMSGIGLQGGRGYLDLLSKVTEKQVAEVFADLLLPGREVLCSLSSEILISGDSDSSVQGIENVSPRSRGFSYPWGGKCLIDVISYSGDSNIVAVFPCSTRVEDEKTLVFSDIAGTIIAKRLKDRMAASAGEAGQVLFRVRKCPDVIQVMASCPESESSQAIADLAKNLVSVPDSGEISDAIASLEEQGSGMPWNIFGDSSGFEEALGVLWNNFFLNHPYGRILDGKGFSGLVHGADNQRVIEPSDMAEFWKRWINSSAMAIVVWGSGDSEVLRRNIDEAFSPMAAPKTPVPAYPFSFAFGQGDEIISRKAVSVYTGNRVAIAYPAPFVGDRDFFPLKVLASYVEEYGTGDVVLDGFLANDSEGLRSGVFSGPDAGIYYLLLAVREGSEREATERLAKYGDELMERVITESELDMARCRAISREMASCREPIDKVARMATALLFDVSDDYFKWFSQGIGTVSAVDVREAARLYCHRKMVLRIGASISEGNGTVSDDGMKAVDGATSENGTEAVIEK
jgi:predicted Zn-dependent peptidase